MTVSSWPWPFNLPVSPGPQHSHIHPADTPTAALRHSFCPVTGQWSSVSYVGTALNICICTCSRKDGCMNPHFLPIFHLLSYIPCFTRTYSNNFCSNFPLPHPPMSILQWLSWGDVMILYPPLPALCPHMAPVLETGRGEAGGIPCVQFSQTPPALPAARLGELCLGF